MNGSQETLTDYIVRTLHTGQQIAPGLFPSALADKTVLDNETILYASESLGTYFGLN